MVENLYPQPGKKVLCSEGACSGFKSLSEDSEFPLRDLALLRAYEVCSPSEKLAELPKEISPWFRELTIEIKLQEAKETPDIKDDIAAITEKSQIETSKKLKKNCF